MTYTKKSALAITGTLGNQSKMPGLSFGISAEACQTGSKLRKIKNSVCEACYACGANYAYPSVKAAHDKRMAGLTRPEWVSAMVYLIGRETARLGVPFFRWHDSGDLQSYEHLTRIVAIAEELPSIKFWLPTKEKRYIKRYLRENNRFPQNLAVRLSATMIDSNPVNLGSSIGYSTVHKEEAPIGEACRAYERKGKCANCRKCWDVKKYPIISYPLH